MTFIKIKNEYNQMIIRNVFDTSKTENAQRSKNAAPSANADGATTSRSMLNKNISE